jgi:class 3 adenylate cyclase
MQCRFCGNDVPGDSEYCNKCGMPIDDAGSTHRDVPDRIALLQEYIPTDLARKILAAGKKIESEKRHVTVLFVDIAGIQTLTEQNVDVEVSSNLLNECLKTLISIVSKYEGTVDKFVGNGIVAIFGAPLAHENDPERALRCADEMKSEIEHLKGTSSSPLPVPFQVRCGLHSGIVIAGNVGNDLRMDYSVVGNTVNIAAGVLDYAGPGEICLSQDFARLVEGIAVTDDPQRVSARGRSEFVEACRLLHIKPVRDASRLIPAADELVGREAEMEKLQNALVQVRAHKHVNIFIRGEAGVGKSRLKWELIRYAKQQGFLVLHGKCSSFETNTPYYLWHALVKSLLGLSDATEHESRMRLHEEMKRLSLPDDEPYIATLLSLRYEEILFEEEKRRREKTFAAVANLLRRVCTNQETVCVLEDIHWIDPFSQGLLEHLIPLMDETPGMIIGVFRDEYGYEDALIGHGELIDLNRLNAMEAVTLMKHRLGVNSIPDHLSRAVMKRSEGNPFFIREILRTLIDQGIITTREGRLEVLSPSIEADIPPTIHGIIMSRIDRLLGGTKEILTSASAIGREFSTSLLHEMLPGEGHLESHLRQLESLELITQKEDRDDTDYLFGHYLIHEVTYNTILNVRRKELHAAIARAIESLYKERLGEMYELLAFHYEKAEMWDKAAEYLSRSGHKVHQIYSKEESESFFRRKEFAIQKLFQSGSAKWSLWATLKAIVPPLIAMLIPILPIFAYVMILGKARNPNIAELLIVTVVASLLCMWYTVSLWYLGVIPFLRGRPHLYDLTEDQVRVLFKDGSNLEIHFSEISELRFRDPRRNAARPFLQKLIDPMGRITEYRALTFKRWLHEVIVNVFPPYSFGFGSRQGEIHIILKEGHRGLRVLVPWFNSPVKSKDISLLPFAPREFFDQFQVALGQWRRNNDQQPRFLQAWEKKTSVGVG